MDMARNSEGAWSRRRLMLRARQLFEQDLEAKEWFDEHTLPEKDRINYLFERELVNLN